MQAVKSAKNECSGLKRGARFRLAFLCLFAVVASSLLVFAPVARADVLDTSPFAKKIHFTVSGYTGRTTLANFPVLVRLSDVSGFDFSDFSTPAAELRFTDAAGNNLNYEIDTWDSVASNALIWVSVPSLYGTYSRQTTEIRAYYGPSSTSGLPSVSSDAVWSSAGYVGVWHFNEQNADGSYPDATGRGATASRIAGDVTPNAPTSATPSPNGTTYHVANSVLAVASANTASWTFSSTGYSVEAWLIPTGNYNRMFVQTTGMNTGNAFAFGPTEVYQMSGEYGGYAGGWTSAVASQSDWRFVTGVWANSGKSFATRTCVNGSNQAGTKDKVAVDFSTSGMALTGRNGAEQGSTVLGFSVDEIRVRTGETSSDWMDANYATQNNPGFLTASPVKNCRSVELSLSVNGGTCAVFSSLVDGISLSGGQSATLKVLYGTDENALSNELIVSDSVTALGTFPAQVKGLMRGTTYYFKAVLELPDDSTIESEVLSVTTITDYVTGMRRVEYIEGTGTQYIDSGYYPGTNTHVKADYQFTAKEKQYRVFGVEGGDFWYQCYINGNGYWAYIYADVASDNWNPVSGNIPANTERHLFDFNYIYGESKRTYTIYGTNGTVTATQSPLETTGATRQSSLSLAIGSQRTAAEVVNVAKHRIYSVQFDEGDALTAALAPAVRATDGAVGLYDSARNRFLPSASADPYVVGPSVTTVERFTGANLTAVDLTFLGAPMERTLKVAYGSGFGGDNPADWDVRATVTNVAAGATSCSVPVPANWGSVDVCAFRCYFDDETSFPLWSDTIVYKATPEPSVSITAVDGSGGDMLVVRGNLGYFPGDDCTLSVRVTKNNGSPVVWSNLTNVTEIGNFELTLLESDTASPRYIEPGAVYSVVVEAESGETSGSSFPVVAVTKGASVFVSSSSLVAQRTVTFTGNLSDLGANTNATVTLYVGETADSLVPVEDPVTRTATGSFNIAHTFDTFDKTYYWQLCAVATTAGGNAITTRTDVASCKTLDKTTYTWQAVDDDWNGDWNDPAHWLSDKTDCLGYPQTSDATADFKNCTTDNPVVVTVNGNYTCGTFKCYGSAASDITFVGTGTNTSSLTGGGYGQTKIASDSTLEFRDMSLTLNGDWELLRNTDRTNVTFRLSGVTGSTTGYFALAAGYCRAEFLNGTDFTGSKKFNIGGTNTVVVIDDSTIRANGSMGFLFNADSKNAGGMRHYFRGKAPRMLSSTTFYPYSHNPDINHQLIFEVPIGGYAEPPIQFTHASTKMFQGGHATADYHVIISPDSPALKRSGEKLENVPLIYAKAGFDLTDTRTMTLEPVEYKGEPSGKLSWGKDGEPLADGENARQVLLDLQGYRKSPTVIRLR